MSGSARIAWLILFRAMCAEIHAEGGETRQALALEEAMRVQHWPRMNEADRNLCWIVVGKRGQLDGPVYGFAVLPRMHT